MSHYTEKILKRRKRGFKDIPAQYIREEWGLSEVGWGERMRRRRIKQNRKKHLSINQKQYDHRRTL